MANSLDEKMAEYERAFDDQFPRMFFRGFSESEIIEAIDSCLKKGEPYRDYDPECEY